MIRIRPTTIAGVCLLLVVALLLPACVDYARIRGIVDESNRLNTILTDSNAAAGGWQIDGSGTESSELADRRAAVIQEIDDYIATHADERKTVNALLVRKALIYLTASETNAALATFDSVERDQLMSDRDRGLYDARRPLAWWKRVAPAVSGLPPDRVFTAQISELDAAIDSLPRGADVRYYLTATRAYMVGKRTMAHAEDAPDAAEMLQGGLAAYASEFDDADRISIQRLMGPPDGQPADFPAERLRAYVQSVAVGRYYIEIARRYDVDPVSWDDVAWLIRAASATG